MSYCIGLKVFGSRLFASLFFGLVFVFLPSNFVKAQAPVKGQETAPFVAGDHETLFRSVVRVVANPRLPSYSSGVMITLDRDKFPNLLKDGEIAILTAAHVADGVSWRGEIQVNGLNITGRSGAKMMSFTKPFPARVVTLFDPDEADLAILAASIGEAEFKEFGFATASVASSHEFRLEENLRLVGSPEGKLPDLVVAHPAQRGGTTKTPLLHVSEPRKQGQSGGPAFNRKGEVVAICSGSEESSHSLALGVGLAGESAKRAVETGTNESRIWGLFVPLTGIENLYQRGEHEAMSRRKLDEVLRQYQEVREAGK